MPTFYKYRQWCKTCNDYTLHRYSTEDELFCECCSTIYSDVYLKDIPEDRLIEQRKRYHDMKFGFVKNIGFNSVFGQDCLQTINDEFPQYEILESDAGQEYLDKQYLENFERVMKEQQEKEELQKKHKKIGRNEPCFCGSGLKFKKCCYDKIYY
jgi:hypothetical protein